MFKIGIRWARGMLKIDVEPSMTIGKLLFEVCQTIKIPQINCKLFRSCSPKSKFIDELDENRTIADEKIKRGDIIYLDVPTQIIPQNIPVAQQGIKCYDIINEFHKDNEKIPQIVKNLQSEYGPRVIAAPFYDMKERGVPQITYQTESSCYAFRVAEEAIKRFQYISLQDHCRVHRVLLLFGRLDKISGKVTIHCSVQPTQICYEDHFEISPTFNEDLCCEVADMFGMKLLGMAVSHPKILEKKKENEQLYKKIKEDKDEDEKGVEIPMPTYLIELAAKYQAKFGEYFTTLAITPVKGKDILHIEAFQVTDAVVKLTQMQLIDDDILKALEDYYKVYFKQDIRVFEQKRKFCHVNLCICAVRIRKVKSKIPSHAFPTLAACPTDTDVQMYFKDNEYCPSWRKFFDFNLLVYMANNGIELSTIKEIVKSIINMEDVPRRILDRIGDRFCYSF